MNKKMKYVSPKVMRFGSVQEITHEKAYGTPSDGHKLGHLFMYSCIVCPPPSGG